MSPARPLRAFKLCGFQNSLCLPSITTEGATYAGTGSFTPLEHIMRFEA
jgi:hypothetical protein